MEISKKVRESHEKVMEFQLNFRVGTLVVKYQPGTENVADSLSRHPKSNGICKQEAIGEECIRYVSCQAIPPSLSAKEIANETEKDPDLQWVKHALLHANKH
jgi:hypothetical protein